MINTETSRNNVFTKLYAFVEEYGHENLQVITIGETLTFWLKAIPTLTPEQQDELAGILQEGASKYVFEVMPEDGYDSVYGVSEGL